MLEIGLSVIVVAAVGAALFFLVALLAAAAKGVVSFARLLWEFASLTATGLTQLRREWRSGERVRTAG
jgi:hypothetical protein